MWVRSPLVRGHFSMVLLLLDHSPPQNQSYELGCAIFACVRTEYIIRARLEPLKSSGRTQEGPENATDLVGG